MPMTRVMVAGAFDFLHPGHLDLFRQAKALGDELVVVVARDESAERAKGKKPFFSEIERLQMVNCVKYVDKAILGNKGDWFEILSELNPDALLLGYDQAVDDEAVRAFVRKRDLKTHVLRGRAFQPMKFKSSRLKELFGV